MQTKSKIPIILILLFAFLTRIVALDQFPPSLNWDEVSHGYNAYSILRTGQDEWGNTLPSIFRAYGDYKLPIYIYASVPFIKFFGLNEYGVRAVSAIAGTALVLYIYLLASLTFKNKLLSAGAAILVAASPWSFFLSRVAVEANLGLTIFVAAVYYAVLGLKRSNWHTVLSAFLFGLSVWTYNSLRVFVPLLILFSALIFRKEIIKVWKNRRKIFLLSLLILAIFLVPMFIQLTLSQGSARYDAIKIIDDGAIASINESRNNSTLPYILNITVNNKVVYFATHFLQNYVKYFSQRFLFISGGDHYQFSTSGWGLMYIFNIPLFWLGLFLAIRLLKKKRNFLMIAWLILAPVAASLTRDAPHALRSFVMFPAIVYFILFGLDYLSRVLKKANKVVFLYSAIIIVFFVFYLTNYSTSYAKKYSWSWQYGYKQVVEYVQIEYEKYDQFIVTKRYGEPHEFFLFFMKYDPAKYKTDSNLTRFNQSNWYWVDRFDKFWFVNDWQIKDLVTESNQKIDCKDSRCLLITSPDNAPVGWSKIDKINFLDDSISFEIYENN